MFVFLVLLFAAAIYFYLRHVYSYWQRQCFPYLEPSIPVGNLGLVVRRQESFGGCLYELYKQSTLPFVGIYMMFKPALLVRDATLAKRILSADFASFHDRGVYCNPKHDPMSANLFAMTGQQWRLMRNKLSPTFTSGKLKSMLPTIAVEADRLQAYLVDSAKREEVLEIKDLLSRYALNVIGSTIFGVDVDTISDPTHAFRQIEKRINNPELINVIKGAAVFLCPKVLEFFNVNSMPKDVQKFMIDIVEQQIEHRERNQISRKDFIQYLIQLRNTDGAIAADDAAEWDIKKDGAMSNGGLKALSIKECAAQVFLFYVAGFDTSASTTAYTLFELARNHVILRKVQREIDETLKRHDGVLTYECLQEMEYMELCINETIRKYPALPILNRECTIDYRIPDSNLTIEKGTSVIISLLGMARDPAYFDDPMVYRPERFSAAEAGSYTADAYMPFGEGPRACIGLRLGILTVKIGLAKLLQSYDVQALDDSEIEFENFAVTLQPKGGIRVRFSDRKL